MGSDCPWPGPPWRQRTPGARLGTLRASGGWSWALTFRLLLAPLTSSCCWLALAATAKAFILCGLPGPERGLPGFLPLAHGLFLDRDLLVGRARVALAGRLHDPAAVFVLTHATWDLHD